MRRSRLPICLFAVSVFCSSVVRAALPAYSFTDFEGAGWSAGPLPAEKSAWHLVQGSAAVVATSEERPAQALALGPSTPFAAVFVETTPVANAPVVFCEVLAKPHAVAGEADAEFLDFGGAVAGFFRGKNGRGELRALFARSAAESVWLSTGLDFPLDESGNAAEWLRIAIRLDRRGERWELRVNGAPVLTGLRALEGRAAGLGFWLYGQESQPCLVDDVLVTTVEPDQLEKLIAAENRRARRVAPHAPAAPGAQIVSRGPAPGAMRSAQPAIVKATRELAVPVVRAWDAALQIGDAHFKSGAEVEIEGRKTSLLIYGPRFDDQGNALPGELTLTADAELRPGADLRRLRWIVVEMKKWPDEFGETIAAGDFRTGLVQTAIIPPEWIRKATSVHVWTAPGDDDVRWWNSRQRQPPAAP